MICSEARGILHAYVDGELTAADTLALEAHLVECVVCREECAELQAGVETVRGTCGVYEAPRASREEAVRLVARHYERRRRWGLAAAVAVCALIGTAGAVVNRRIESHDRFAAFAAETHVRYASGTMPLDIRSDEPAEVAEWLSRHLTFVLTLPNYPEREPKKYMLAGARLLQYGEDDVAYMAYRMNGRPISLLMASSRRIVPSGGVVYQSGGLTFHSVSSNGLQTITWADRGLSYALVSDLKSVGAESCVVCHGGAGEDRKFAPLRPRT